MRPVVPAVVVDAVLEALAVLAPVDCAGCGAPGRALCVACRAHLRPDPRPTRRGDLLAWSSLDYGGVAARVIVAFKDSDRPGLARALGPALRAAVVAALAAAPPGTPVRIVAMPSSRAGWRRRGYRPVMRLLRHAGLRGSGLLRQRRGRADQVGLGAEQRRANVAGTIVVRRPRSVEGTRILLVDDIITTGASAAEAVGALRRAGAMWVGIAALAETPKKLGTDRTGGNKE